MQVQAQYKHEGEVQRSMLCFCGALAGAGAGSLGAWELGAFAMGSVNSEKNRRLWVLPAIQLAGFCAGLPPALTEQRKYHGVVVQGSSNFAASCWETERGLVTDVPLKSLSSPAFWA